MTPEIENIVRNILGADAPIELSVPDEELFGHYATNVALRQAKARRVPPLDLAKEYAAQIAVAARAGFFQKVEAAAPGFINFWLSEKTLQEEFKRVAADKKYGEGTIGKGRTVIVEHSSTNIARALHIGYLRNAVIGDALANLLEASGYRVIRWNYLGDWGTQFGKLIAAYKMWGDKKVIEKNPIEELQKLYVRFHAEMKTDSALEKRGQEEFKKLEEGDRANRSLWTWFKRESLEEFKRIYKLLDIDFDVWIGEAFFEKEIRTYRKRAFDQTDSGAERRSDGDQVWRGGITAGAHSKIRWSEPLSHA